MALPSYAKGNPRYASLIMDADTGFILHERYADKKLHPASLTKAMTLLMVFEALDQGRLNLKDRIRISRHAASMVPSKLNLPVGSSIRVKDAILALVTKSANDVAAAVAEHIGGSEYNFAKMMTARARRIGMKHTTFKNASGLHDARQVTTARDMARMARFIIHNYPHHYKVFSTQYFTYNGKSYRNHNRLMASYKGMDGLKTGYISASGFNLIASAVRKNRRLIGVVFGGRSSKTRNAHMKKLLDQGFKDVQNLLVADFEAPIPRRKPSMQLALSALNNLAPAAGSAYNNPRLAWSSLNASLQSGMFKQLIGEGDSDPAMSSRLETGLIAIAAHKGEAMPYMQPQKHQSASLHSAAYSPTQSVKAQNWAVQIGAFQSRVKTDQVLGNALLQLPPVLAQAKPLIVPVRNGNAWLFRARLSGYTEAQALSTCNLLPDCIAIEPHKAHSP